MTEGKTNKKRDDSKTAEVMRLKVCLVDAFVYDAVWLSCCLLFPAFFVALMLICSRA